MRIINLEEEVKACKRALRELEQKYEDLSHIKKIAAVDCEDIRERIVSGFRDLVDDVDIIYDALKGMERNFDALDEQLGVDIQHTEKQMAELRELIWRYEKEIEANQKN